MFDSIIFCIIGTSTVLTILATEIYCAENMGEGLLKFLTVVSLLIHSQLAFADVAQDAAIDTLLPARPPLHTGNYWDVCMLALLLFIIFLSLFLWLKMRRNQSTCEIKVLPSFQQFLKDLHKAKSNMGEQSAKHFCSTLCDAMKSYLQREYKLPLTCRTTEEFLRIFGKSTQFSWEKINALSDILQYSDMAKFAQGKLSVDLQKDIFLKTCQFIRAIRRARRQHQDNTVHSS